jgi:salicylate hydroxylase
MLPYLAQGLNSGLEDGAVLGRLLGHVQDLTQIDAATSLYQSLRKSRSEAIARETFKQVSHHIIRKIQNLSVVN